MPINFLQLIHFYKAITSAISGQYERTFKGKDKGVEPFAQPQAVNTPLKSRDIENAFSRFTNGNESETADFKVLAKQIPMYALQRKPSNNDSLNQEERKTAFSTERLLLTEIQASPDIILPSGSLPLKSEPYADDSIIKSKNNSYVSGVQTSLFFNSNRASRLSTTPLS